MRKHFDHIKDSSYGKRLLTFPNPDNWCPYWMYKLCHHYDLTGKEPTHGDCNRCGLISIAEAIRETDHYRFEFHESGWHKTKRVIKNFVWG